MQAATCRFVAGIEPGLSMNVSLIIITTIPFFKPLICVRPCPKL